MPFRPKLMTLAVNYAVHQIGAEWRHKNVPMTA